MAKPYNRMEGLDITAPELVEIKIRFDKKVVWVNIDGICRLRVCQIKNLKVQDDSRTNK